MTFLWPSAISLIFRDVNAAIAKMKQQRTISFVDWYVRYQSWFLLWCFHAFLTQVPNWVQSGNKLSTTDCCSQRRLGSSAQVLDSYLLLLSVFVSISFLLLFFIGNIAAIHRKWGEIQNNNQMYVWSYKCNTLIYIFG